MISPKLPPARPDAMLWRSSGSRDEYELYSHRIDRAGGLFIFLIDQSHAWASPLNNGEVLAQNVAQAINSWLHNLCIACCYDWGCIRTWPHIVVLGYRSDDDGNPIVQPALIGPLHGREVVSICEVAENPARIDTVNLFMTDEETGEILEMPQQIPSWIDPVAKGKAPLCAAIVRACRFVDEWIPNYPDSFPPIVVNISSGTLSDGNPWPFADALKRRGTRDGHVLFMNMYVSARVRADPVIFPHAAQHMPDASASTLLACSSYLPPVLLHRRRNCGLETPEQAKCMSVNADLISMLKLISFGSSGPRLLR